MQQIECGGDVVFSPFPEWLRVKTMTGDPRWSTESSRTEWKRDHCRMQRTQNKQQILKIKCQIIFIRSNRLGWMNSPMSMVRTEKRTASWWRPEERHVHAIILRQPLCSCFLYFTRLPLKIAMLRDARAFFYFIFLHFSCFVSFAWFCCCCRCRAWINCLTWARNVLNFACSSCM